MTKVALALFVLAFGGLAGWLYWSPGHTVHQLETAARKNDTATVARLVDFKPIREQLVADIKEARAPFVGKRPNMDALSKSVSPLVWSLVRDDKGNNQFASPTGFAALIRSGGNTLQPDAPPDSAHVSMRYLKYPRTFEVVMFSSTPPVNQPYPDTVTMLLERKGLAWQVKQARIPIHLCKSGCEAEEISPH